ncbi:unnamed protein product [Knipowitschia caucasica]
MDQLKVKDRILENISLSVKKLQSYFAACEDETPAIRNHDRVLQRLCEHIDHALLYGLQDISSGYWVLVLHFTRREAVRQIEELQHIATNLGRSRAWLYLALSESSLESYLRLFQENQALLHKYYFKNALVCSDDHLTLFLTLVSGLEFIRFDLELDVPYLDVAPYMPEYYKPHNLLDFEERLPSSDSISLHSFTSLNSTNLEWDDSAIAPSSEEGDVTSCLHSGGSDPQTVVSDPVVASSCPVKSGMYLSPHSPTSRHNPFNEDSDTNNTTSADITPVHVASHHSTGPDEDMDLNSNELEVIRMARRRKPAKKRRGKGSTDSSCSIHNSVSSENMELGLQESTDCTMDCTMDSEGERRSKAGTELLEEEEQLLRLPKMADTSMDGVGKPLRDVMDRINGALDQDESWEHLEEEHDSGRVEPTSQQPFLEDSAGEPPDPGPADRPTTPLTSPTTPLTSPYLQGITEPSEKSLSAPLSPEPDSSCSGSHDPAEQSQPQTVPSGHADEGEAERRERPEFQLILETHCAETEQQLSPFEVTHPAEFKVDNNHLLLLMIHVFRENEEQLFKMLRMSTGHMEGDLQPLFMLLTDCYIYLLRKGAAEKPYTVEDAVSYNELDYISVGLDQQALTLVCTNRRRKFLLETADASLTIWLLSVMNSSMVKGCREPPYPTVLTDATMEKLALTKFVAQESQCEVAEVCIHLYSLVHWEDPLDTCLSPVQSPSSKGSSIKEGTVQYKAGTTYLGKEQWKSCYLVLSKGALHLYSEQTDLTPLQSVTMGGEHCGGCRRSNSTERPHAFQVILTERPPLELSASNEQDMAEWMQLLCQSVSKGVIPQGVAPTPCIPCCLVLTDMKLLTCHQDCQTSFFRSLGAAELCDVTAVSLEANKEYCIIEFAADRSQFLPPWVLYFSGCDERDRLLHTLNKAWKDIYQVDLPQTAVSDQSVQKRCGEALALMKSAWQRADSLARGRAQREPWC